MVTPQAAGCAIAAGAPHARIKVGVLGWPIFGVGYAWSVGAVFPEIKKVLASFSLCRCE